MMNLFTFNWKTGLLTAVATVVIGIGFFVLVGSRLDFTCANTSPRTTSCRAYNGIKTVMNGYADFWLQFFASRCVGGGGPDDCIGPNIGIMFWTLTLGGFVVGGTSRRKKITNVQPQMKKTT